jgi:DNA-binding PadR family transcriptional regulator
MSRPHRQPHAPRGEQRAAHPGFTLDDRRGGHHRGRGRLFDQGELRLVVLSLIAERPRHGYDIIKAIEERLCGTYAPSPGVIYPTLTLLEDIGQVVVAPEAGGRKLHSITSEGRAVLAENAASLQATLARMDQAAGMQANNPPAAILRAMENLKMALRLRLGAGPVTPDQADSLAAAIDAAAVQVGRA